VRRRRMLLSMAPMQCRPSRRIVTLVNSTRRERISRTSCSMSDAPLVPQVVPVVIAHALGGPAVPQAARTRRGPGPSGSRLAPAPSGSRTAAALRSSATRDRTADQARQMPRWENRELGKHPQTAPEGPILQLAGHGHEPWLSVDDRETTQKLLVVLILQELSSILALIAVLAR
jgi:hypothetical protein